MPAFSGSLKKKKQRLWPELGQRPGCESLLKKRAAVRKKYQREVSKSNKL
jgi:hypothetical protein